MGGHGRACTAAGWKGVSPAIVTALEDRQSGPGGEQLGEAAEDGFEGGRGLERRVAHREDVEIARTGGGWPGE